MAALVLTASAGLQAAPDGGGGSKERDEYPCDRFGLAHSYTLKSEPIFSSAETAFARLTPGQARTLRRLQASSVQVSEVLVAGGRLLWSLPPAHPLGPLKLVLVDDGEGKLFVLDPTGRKRYELSPGRLPDLLDGTAPSRRTHLKLRVAPAVGAASNAALPYHRDVAMTPWQVELDMRIGTGPAGRRRTNLQLGLRVWTEAGPGQLPHREPLLALALPLLVGSAGAPALEAMAHRMGRPVLGWQVTARPRGGPGHPPAVERVTVVDRGWMRVPLCRLASTRPAYKAAAGEPGFAAPGRQLLPAAELGGLRKGLAAGMLSVDNRTPTAAMVYVDGALLGWVAPRRRHGFKGLSAGFYRVVARSPLGTAVWGPFDMYVPGPVVLR